MDNTFFFLIINVALVVGLLLFFLKGKSSQPPSKLNLSGKKKLNSSHIPRKADNIRSLTIYFEHKGETKEAYQVLGLPAGAPLEMAEATYKDILEEKTETDDVYLKAIEAIRQAYQKTA